MSVIYNMEILMFSWRQDLKSLDQLITKTMQSPASVLDMTTHRTFVITYFSMNISLLLPLLSYFVCICVCFVFVQYVKRPWVCKRRYMNTTYYFIITVCHVYSLTNRNTKYIPPVRSYTQRYDLQM